MVVAQRTNWTIILCKIETHKKKISSNKKSEKQTFFRVDNIRILLNTEKKTFTSLRAYVNFGEYSKEELDNYFVQNENHKKKLEDNKIENFSKYYPYADFAGQSHEK